MPDLKSFKNIAIIQTAFLGDVALSLYLAQKIKNYHQDSQLLFVTTPASASFVSCCDVIDHVIAYDKRGMQQGWKGIRSIVEQLDNFAVDCIIAPHRSLRTTLISKKSKAKFSVSFDKSAFSIFHSKRVKWRLGHHETMRNHSLLSVFDDFKDISDGLPNVKLNISDDDKIYIENLLLKYQIDDFIKLIAIAPGSVWMTKRWETNHFKSLAATLAGRGYKIVIIGSKSDREIAESIADSDRNICDFTGLTTLPQLMYLLSLSQLLITNDSSPTHFAGLVKCPTITIYGPTVPEFGFHPLGEKDVSIGIEDLKCRPCEIHGSNKCSIKTFDCMNNLEPDVVIKKCMSILNDKST